MKKKYFILRVFRRFCNWMEVFQTLALKVCLSLYVPSASSRPLSTYKHVTFLMMDCARLRNNRKVAHFHILLTFFQSLLHVTYRGSFRENLRYCILGEV